MTKDIYAPKERESIHVGQQTNSFSISISDGLLASVKMSRVCFRCLSPLCVAKVVCQFEDSEIGYVTGRVITHPSSTIPILEPVSVSSTPSSSGKTTGGKQVLGSRAPASLPRSTMIGELKLTSLKSRLAAVGVQAELIGEGVLICGGGKGTGTLEDSVSVRKTAKGKVELEGNVSDVYYTVRREIYSLHALVAA
jgi:cleavage and polyadenylation specificity factor subunit 2